MTEALATRNEAALAQIPAHLRQQYGNRAGLEGLGKDDVLIPRLCVAQSMTPQVKKANELYIQGLEIGQFFNSVTNDVYGAKVTVIPLFFFKQYIEFKPIEQGGGVVAFYETALDVPAGGLAFGTDDKGDRVKPRVTEFKNEMSLLVGENGTLTPIVCSFKSSGLKTAKKWNALMRSLNLPAYARKYDLQIVNKTKGTYDWESVNVLPQEFVSEEFFSQAEAYFSSLREAGVKVDTTGMAEEREAGSDDVQF